MTGPKDSTSKELRATFNELRSRIDALEALGERTEGYGRLLINKVLRLFPRSLRLLWLREIEDNDSKATNLRELLDFLHKEIQRVETVEKLDTNQTPSSDDEGRDRPCSTEGLHVQVKTKRNTRRPKIQPFCVFCDGKGHWGQDCGIITKPDQRKRKLQDQNRCFLCLGRHRMKDCPRRGVFKCASCRASDHHTAICEATTSTAVHAVVDEVTRPDTDVIYLQTAKVRLRGANGKETVTRCVFDTGSHRSFIDAGLAKKLELKPVGTEELYLKSFEASSKPPEQRARYRLTLNSTVDQTAVTIEAVASTNTYNLLPEVTDSGHSRVANSQLADGKRNSRNLPIQILIGSDYYWSVVQGNIKRISDHMVLVQTKFGWVLSGGERGSGVTEILTLHVDSTNITADPPIDSLIRNFWELEALGIADETGKPPVTEDEAMDHFRRTFTVNDGRAVVSLPWNENRVHLLDNYQVAKTRFESLKKRFARDETFRQHYTQGMVRYFKQNHIEKVAPEDNTGTGPVFYLPHQAVLKDKNGVATVRIVFDASAHDRGALSLNDALHSGPNMSPDSASSLLRFREQPKVIIGDGTQAFLQLGLNEEDRDATRFIWFDMNEDDDGTIRLSEDDAIYRFTRLPFGLTCSPFPLAATLRTYAQHRGSDYPAIAPLIERGFYVDDFTAGAEDDAKLLAIYNELSDLTAELSLPMGKWNTNSEALKARLRQDGFEPPPVTKVLGLPWDTTTDEFWVEGPSFQQDLNSHTKRQVLTTLAKLYDPLGLVSPFTILGKILFQLTWTRGLDWDALLPHDLQLQWSKWLQGIRDLHVLRIPRWIGLLSECDQQRELHLFCDASERAYGTVAYIRSNVGDSWSVKLLMSKSRLAPLKPVTLPRLELLGTLLGVRLLQYIQASADLHYTSVTLWADSTVALSWIRSAPSRWKPFVANRVVEIQKATTPQQWRFCPGEQNPADHLTRGLTVQRLREQSDWWNGPTWLRHPESTWPEQAQTPSSTASIKQEERSCRKTTVLNTEVPSPLIDVARINRFWTVVRVMAWAQRFLSRARRPQLTLPRELTAGELQEAQNALLRLHQMQYFPTEIRALQEGKELPKNSPIRTFNPYLDDEGMLRLGGRLQQTSLEDSIKHPILLEGRDAFIRLMIKAEHERLFHLGVRMILSELRSRFWILHGRQVIRQVINQCLPCKKLSLRPGEQMEPPLPLDRVQAAAPFDVVGIDFAGPLTVPRNSALAKAYIALFTCAVTRAVHLELVSDMSADRFILALQRFFGRRGVSRIIYTDNAKTFKAVESELQDLWKTIDGSVVQRFLAHQGVQWKYIVERAPWWGGWWERMVQTTKRCLKKSLGKLLLGDEELTTILVGIEATINSRPITYTYHALTDPEPVTPAHFLVGNRLTRLPQRTEKEITTPLSKVWRRRQQLMDEFWKRWTKEYLLDLRSFHTVAPRGRDARPLRKDEVVLVMDEARPRHLWKLGRVLDVVPGRDGRPRSCVLRMPHGQQIRRPIQLVIPLEFPLDQGGECGESVGPAPSGNECAAGH